MAGADRRANDSREHLFDLCIGINESINGVFLRYTDLGTGADHRGLHTDRYPEDGRTALLNAVWSAESSAAVIEALLDGGADASVADANYGLTPREWAVKTGKRDVVDLLAAADGA